MNQNVNDLSQETVQKMLGMIMDLQKTSAAQLDTTLGLQTYSLEAPSKLLVPQLTPLRNTTPRIKGLGNSTNWKAITGIDPTGGPDISVAEKVRSSGITYTEVDKAVAFRSWGEDDTVTWEAEIQGVGFQDMRALSNLATMKVVMIGEEDLQLGGNNSSTGITVTAPGVVTKSAGGTGGTLPTLTYDVSVVFLPYMGYRGISGLTLPARHTAAASTVTQAITLGQHLYASVPQPASGGAMAYAWFIGASGAARLEAITSVNFLDFSTPLAGTGTLLSAVGATSTGSATNFDGMLTQTYQNGYVKHQTTGTSSVSYPLTSDGAGGIVEFDAILKYQWDTNRTGFDEILCNSQEAGNIFKKIVGSSGTNAVRLIIPSDQNPLQQPGVIGGGKVGFYVNKYTGGVIPVVTHPTMPAGTVFFRLQNLPPWYKENNVAGAWVMRLVRDYTEIVYGPVLRAWEHGVYARGALEGYLPGLQAILDNIADG